VSFEVAPGHAVGVVGGNGSGKTTLLRIIAGITEPSRGDVRIRGRITSLIDLAPGQDRDLTGLENLRLRAVLGGISRADTARLWDRMVEFTGISADQLGEPVHTYSAGMLLRVAAAAALVRYADVIAIDEVLAVGDADFQRRCLDRIEIMVSSGAAAVLVSHDHDLIAGHCSHVYVLDAGRFVASGPPRTVLKRAPMPPPTKPVVPVSASEVLRGGSTPYGSIG
jgi:ABC-type polysaccharide/polyol phosphate transport system ATPase subunit